MVTYIYFVKCPNCEDEHFDFFDDAKAFAMSCMSQKPIITQTEVCRNDFGECTDSVDLGTVWSWEDAMQGVSVEPECATFSKAATFGSGCDPEFDNLDNSVDCEVEEPETSEVSTVERKPIPEGMTIEQLVEEMEENEDTVECTWCNDLFDKSECRKEVDLGWLCSRCEMAIKSRGETLTFREGNYWDFLDEDLEDTRTLTELVKDSISHLANDLGKDPWAEDFTDDVIKDIETNYDSYVPEDMEHYNYWCSAVASEVSRQLNNQLDEDPKITTTEGLFTKKGYVIKAIHKNRPELPFYYCGKPEYDWESPFNFVIDKKKAKVYISIEEANRDVADLMANEDIMRDFSSIEAFSLSNIVEDVKEIHDLGNEYDGGYPAKEAEAEPGIEETTEVSGSHLTHCPECGKNTFDIETGICVECGFN